jgi:hypothetical protein
MVMRMGGENRVRVEFGRLKRLLQDLRERLEHARMRGGAEIGIAALREIARARPECEAG